MCASVTVVGVVCGNAHASTCADTSIGRIRPTEDGLRVDQTAVPTLHVGDILVQLNSHRLQTCADLAEGLIEAHRNALGTLFLIRRDGKVETALVAAPPAVVAAGAPVAPPVKGAPPMPIAAAAAPIAQVPPAVPTAIPPPPVPTTPPTPLSRADADTARELLAECVAFGRDLQARQPLPMAQPWAQRVEQLRQRYNSQQARGAAVGLVDPILGYYETVAQILLYKETVTRERRDIRARGDIVLEYHSNSPVPAWVQRYPFLRPSVLREPDIGLLRVGESNGQWLPDRAVALLLDRAVAEGTALSSTLAAGAPG